MRSLLDSHYPRIVEASRRRKAHETASGRSLRGWRMRSQYGLDR